MNTQPTRRHCPKCNAALAEDSPQGLCPRCLLAAASEPTESGDPTPATRGLPTLEAVQAAFPHLEILGLIGRGGMGVVYKARQPRLDRVVALKLLPCSPTADPAFAERFNREARVLARLNHPNIVTVHDFGQAGDFFYLLMEFVDGVNLRQAMRAGRFSPPQALGLVPKVCEALQSAHDDGILHRDIKPENILLDSRGRVKIADFGIAKLVGEPHAPTRLTMTGAVVGTPNYMAPEQLEHPEDVDARADIYSLGVVFYEMLTGELPIGRFAPPSKKTEIDGRVDEIVLKALARERELRQQSAGEVKTQVENLRNPAPDEPPKALAVAPAPSAPRSAVHVDRTGADHWSRPAIWGGALTGLSLPPVLGLLGAGLLGMGGLGPAEAWIILASLVLLAVPGTLLGWIAMGQIRRGQGRVLGLPIAVFAAMAWPVLVPLLGTALPLWVTLTENQHSERRLLLLLPIGILALGVWAVRAAARWAGSSGQIPESAPEVETPESTRPTPGSFPVATRWSRTTLFALCGGIGVVIPAMALALSVWLPMLNRPSPGRVNVPPLPPLGTVTNGIGAEFTVPAGRVAVLEVVTRSNHLTVPIPNLAAYVVAPANDSYPATFRLTRLSPASTNRPARLRWAVEVATARGTSSTSGLTLPAELEPGVGARGIGLGVLTDQESIHWGHGDEAEPPANGGVGLRVRTQPHGLGPGAFGDLGNLGTGTNWSRARPR